jgi:hypothetical protein
MKKIVLLVFVMSFSMFFFGCASSAEHNEQIPADKTPGPGESLVIVQRISSFAGKVIKMQIWIDDEEVVGSIKNDVRSFIVIPNGSYTIQAGSTKIDRGNEITFTVNDEEISFQANPAFGIVTTRFNLTETGRRNLKASD